MVGALWKPLEHARDDAFHSFRDTMLEAHTLLSKPPIFGSVLLLLLLLLLHLLLLLLLSIAPLVLLKLWTLLLLYWLLLLGLSPFLTILALLLWLRLKFGFRLRLAPELRRPPTQFVFLLLFLSPFLLWFRWWWRRLFDQIWVCSTPQRKCGHVEFLGLARQVLLVGLRLWLWLRLGLFLLLLRPLTSQGQRRAKIENHTLCQSEATLCHITSAVVSL